MAIDGSKVRANASKHQAMSDARRVEKERQLQQEVLHWLTQAGVNDKRQLTPMVEAVGAQAGNGASAYVPGTAWARSKSGRSKNMWAWRTHSAGERRPS